MATNRFICEVCNKGFQREQNLQLHRRGHNLPWKLRQKTNKDQVKKKVYLCPEPTCVHHDPARALGDLTGIKKHYSRKHGEKKFKCEKCSKRYAVQSDWKAHSKTCGTREYRCDCGTLFSRRDSFITHRAFCDALAQESARHPTSLSTLGSHLFGPPSVGGGNTGNNNMGLGVGLPHQVANHLPASLSDQMTSDILRLGGGARGVGTGQFDHLLGQGTFRQQHHNIQQSPASYYLSEQTGGANHFANNSATNDQENQSQNAGGGIFSNKLFTGQLPVPDLGFFSNNNNSENTNTINSSSNNNGSGDHNGMFSPSGSNSLFGGHPAGSLSTLYTTGPALQASPHMSATALLQKAAQMGSTTSTSNASATALLKGLEAKPTQQQSTPPPPPTSAGGGGGGGFGGLFGENDQNNLHDLLMRDNLMNSPFFGGDHQSTGATGDHSSNYGGFNPNKTGLSVGSSDRLTRDFLGVGEIVRSMSGGGGFPANSQGMAAIDVAADHRRNNSAAPNNSNANNTAPSSSQAFGGGNNF